MRIGTAGLMLALAASASIAQVASFDIEWRTLAVAHSNMAEQRPKLERTYARLPARTATDMRVERVSAVPEVVVLGIGQNFCLSSLDLGALDSAGQRLQGVAVSVDVRADDLPGLRVLPNKQDVCFRPAKPGEYAIRFTSLVPARDGTFRGAQMFIRVQSLP